MRKLLFWCAFAIGSLSTLNCSAVIIYVDIPEDEESFVFVSLATKDFDFNGDGAIDLIFSASNSGFTLRPQGNNRIITVFENNLAPLDAGFSIGEAIDNANGAQWWGDKAFISSCMSTPIGVQCDGAFTNLTAFMGAEFEIEGETHYGWIQIREFAGLGGFFFDFAYESEPGVGILAGAIAIPEPSVSILLFFGLAVMVLRKRL